MYKVAIIDDEPIVRQGLKKIIDWEEYGFSICCEGIDGEDGLEKVLEFNPELVLVDVKMPGRNGIELIRCAKDRGFEGHFVILTGYSEFEYAKSAIALGVKAYFLKPIDEDEIIRYLKEVKDELDEIRSKDEMKKAYESKARVEVLRSLLIYADYPQIDEDMKMYNINHDYSVFCVAILNNDIEDLEAVKTMKDGFSDVEDIADIDKRIFIIKGIRYEQAEKILKRNNEKIKRKYGKGFFISVGHDVVSIRDVHFSYECAKMLNGYRFLYENDDVITIKVMECDEEEIGFNLAEMICSFIDIGECEKIKEYVETYLSYCKKRLMTESEIKVKVVHSILRIQNILGNKYEDKKKEFPDVYKLYGQIEKITNIEEVSELLSEYCLGMSDIIGASNAENVVIRMHAYMESNYQKDIKLEILGKLFNYNSAYLGKIFKKEMGESFNNALDNIRIEKAKSMLENTDLKVYQVSEKVGYSNIDYFYAKFKKYVGMSPKEYKSSRKGECVL